MTVNGAIAQYFRGAVGTYSGTSVVTGYLKAYTYDDRLKYLLHPSVSSISNAGWELSRETTCTPGGQQPEHRMLRHSAAVASSRPGRCSERLAIGRLEADAYAGTAPVTPLFIIRPKAAPQP